MRLTTNTVVQGLSYTEFDVKWATPPPTIATVTSKTDSATTYKVTVKNIGKVSGDEVVLAYTKPKAHTLRGSLGEMVPIEQKKLFGFQRVTVPAGSSADLSFELTPAHLAMVDENGHTGLHNGEFEVVFSRGHGKELVAQSAVQLTDQSDEASRLKTFRKWW
jgi:beta-glucosidase